MGTLLAPLYAGGTCVLNRRFSAAQFWSRAAAERVQVAPLAPALLESLLAAGDNPHAYDLSHFRGVVCTGAPLAAETVRAFEERLFPVFHGYGLRETTACAGLTPPDLPAAERRRWYGEHGWPTIGCEVPGCHMTIMGPDGAELGAGERGEICLRGPLVMAGYHGQPAANAGAFPGHGYFCSGDAGFWLPGPDGRRYFFITGRLSGYDWQPQV